MTLQDNDELGDKSNGNKAKSRSGSSAKSRVSAPTSSKSSGTKRSAASDAFEINSASEEEPFEVDQSAERAAAKSSPVKRGKRLTSKVWFSILFY